MRICSGAGCLRAVPDDIRFCDECKPVYVPSTDEIREHTLTDRERYATLYSGSRWQRVRIQVIKGCPLCSRCDLSISEIADHIVPAGVAIAQARDSGLYPHDRYAGFYLRSNLHGLCRGCHYLKTIEDKAHCGGWPDIISIEQLKTKRAWTFG
jgi:5-methylcytosine-specific restriction endonuclease McrA